MRILGIIMLLAVNTGVMALENQLRQHASPYLAMHGSDPVAWQQWNSNSIGRAKKEGKLLYVSSGYFSCHWCHVMQRESYKNKEVAKILNENFIPVKVDREIEGALDSRLIDFVERTQGQAGWPLNVFITPDGYPLVGMTYLPKNNFIEVLNNLKTRWKNERALLEKIAFDATAELSDFSHEDENEAKQPDGKENISRFLTQARSMADDLSGGFGDQSKFPSVPQLSVLLKVYKDNHDGNLKQFLQLTLDKMASQGLYDELEGGFFRYTIDPTWQTPHFEKMLYDNALLASLYMDAAVILNDEQYADIAKATLDFMMAVFESPQGGLIASLSAIDDKGIEGGYYLWQTDDLQKSLGADEFKVVKLSWNLDTSYEPEHGYHLVPQMSISEVAKKLHFDKDKTKKLLNSAKVKLRLVRSKRGIPRDEKLLAGWNGLALSAFSKAAKRYNNNKYATTAKRIKDYIYHNLWRDAALVRAVKDNKVYGMGELEDYAYVINGVYDWLELSANQKDQLWLEELISQSWSKFYAKDGWRLSRNNLLKYKQGEYIIVDGVLPSPSAVIINISIKYAMQTKNTQLMNRAAAALKFTLAEMLEQPFWYASHIYTLYFFQGIKQ